MTTIKLRSSDGIVIEVDLDVIKSFGIFKTMLEYLGMADDEEQVIPVFKVNANILILIIQWIKYHKDDPLPPEDYMDKRRTDDISTWDAEFMNVDSDIIYELLEAADYLEIEMLYNLLCKSVAKMMMGQTPEEIRRKFGIRNNFSASEEEQIRNGQFVCRRKVN